MPKSVPTHSNQSKSSPNERKPDRPNPHKTKLPPSPPTPFNLPKTSETHSPCSSQGSLAEASKTDKRRRYAPSWLATLSPFSKILGVSVESVRLCFKKRGILLSESANQVPAECLHQLFGRQSEKASTTAPCSSRPVRRLYKLTQRPAHITNQAIESTKTRAAAQG